MCALGVVELQRSREGFQHALGDPVEVSPFQAGVAVDIDPGQQRDLFTA